MNVPVRALFHVRYIQRAPTDFLSSRAISGPYGPLAQANASEKEAVLPNGSLDRGALIRSWRWEAGGGVQDFEAMEKYRTGP